MSTDLIERRDAGYKLTSFYGGDARGVCLQITALNGDGFIQLDHGGADLLIQDVRHLFVEKQDPAKPHADWLKAHQAALTAEAQAELKAAELKAAEKRLVKTETELVEARRVNGQMSKELEALRERLAQTERNLARAQGYIDRVTEGEPPLPGVRNEVHERVGNVGVSYINGPEPRGPKLDLGTPYHTDGYGLSR